MRTARELMYAEGVALRRRRRVRAALKWMLVILVVVGLFLLGTLR